jgi:hypothetical protein
MKSTSTFRVGRRALPKKAAIGSKTDSPEAMMASTLDRPAAGGVDAGEGSREGGR